MILQICEVKSEKNLLLGKGDSKGSKILAVSSQGHHGVEQSRIFR